MSELWLNSPTKFIFDHHHIHRPKSEQVLDHRDSSLNDLSSPGDRPSRIWSIDSSECNLSSRSLSDSDSLFIDEDEDLHDTDIVQRAVSTLTRHNLLLIEKLRSAKYQEGFSGKDDTGKVIEDNMLSVNILQDNINMKCSREKLPILGCKSTEIYLLKTENCRLKGALEERKEHSQTLHNQIEILKGLLEKNEQANGIQQRRLERLEQQIYQLGITNRWGVKSASSASSASSDPLISSRRQCYSDPISAPSYHHSFLDVTRARTLSDGARPVHHGYQKRKASQRYASRYKPRRCNRDVSITFTETPQQGPHKVILVGDSGVGKSSFMLRLCDDSFNEKMNPSFGLDFKTKAISVEGSEENIQLWDTAGQERFRSITQSYFRKVDGIILVYDITHEESFLNLQNWVTCIQESGQLSAPMTIVGNKLDLEHLRCVSREMATELADFYEADFVEVSAKDGKNIHEVGYDLVRKLVERRKANSHNSTDTAFSVNSKDKEQCSEQTSCCVIL